MASFHIIPPASLSIWWGAVERFLTQCPDTWNEYETVESIYDALRTGQHRLAVLLEDNKVKFCGIFQVNEYPKVQTVQVFWCAGENMGRQELEPFMMGLESFAKKNGLAYVECGPSRPGFERWLGPMGYEKVRVYTRKKIQQETLQ